MKLSETRVSYQALRVSYQALRWPYHIIVIRLPDSAIRLSDGPIRVPQDTDGSIRVLYGHIRLSVQVEPIRLSDMALPGSQMVLSGS